MNALELQGLTKHYKDFTLGPLDLTLPGGTICGLIGENGAGKSTTIRLILDMVQRDGGTVTILGRDSRTASVRSKEEIGVVLGSVGSAAGRLLMPMLSDKIGRRPTDLILFGASLGLSAAFLFAQGWAVVAVYASLTFCYSALAAVLPALSTDLFGLPHAGVNYGFLALGQSVGSLAFPFAANLWGLATGRHWLAMGGAAAGFAAIWALRPVQPLRPPKEN